MEFYLLKNNKSKSFKYCNYFQTVSEAKVCYNIITNRNDKKRIKTTTFDKLEYKISYYKPVYNIFSHLENEKVEEIQIKEVKPEENETLISKMKQSELFKNVEFEEIHIDNYILQGNTFVEKSHLEYFIGSEEEENINLKKSVEDKFKVEKEDEEIEKRQRTMF
jgi:hypothetical protein